METNQIPSHAITWVGAEGATIAAVDPAGAPTARQLNTTASATNDFLTLFITSSLVVWGTEPSLEGKVPKACWKSSVNSAAYTVINRSHPENVQSRSAPVLREHPRRAPTSSALPPQVPHPAASPPGA